MKGLDVFNLADFVSGSAPPRSLLLTTYSADESILHVIANASRLAPPSLEFHYELSRFVPYSSPVVSRLALKHHAPVGVSTGPNRLPVWHPKVSLASWRGRHTLVLSTANLTPADLRVRGNVAARLEVSTRAAQRVVTWARSRNPHKTLVVKQTGGVPKLAISNRSTWAQFSPLLATKGVKREEWLIASPFWSDLSQHLGSRPIQDFLLTAFGPSKEVLQRALVGLANARVKAHVPQVGDFHQKVICVRQVLRRSTRVVLYVGSANATTSGFFGRSGKAFNWEAGLIQVGTDALWNVANELARTGPGKRWKQVKLRTTNVEVLGDLELGPEEETKEELEAELRTFFFLNLNLSRKGLRLRAPVAGTALLLQNPRLLVDGRSLKLTQKFQRLPVRTQEVVAVGDFLWKERWRGLEAGFRCPVRLPLPQLLPEPLPEEVALTAEELIRQLAEPGPVQQGGEGLGNGSGTVEGRRKRLRDIRFPWARFAQTEARLGPESPLLARWIETVRSNPYVPGFWREIATALRGDGS